MPLTFARPSIADLVFHLYGRSVHPELFRMHAEMEVWQESYLATIRICDAGHVVGFQFGGNVLSEVTAAREQPLPQRKRLFEKRLHGHRDETFQLDAGLQYHVSYQLEQLEPEVFVNIHEELLADCARANLSHRFPAGHRLAPEPLSLIRTDAGPRSLLVHTFHTFPESCAVVKTQSLFEL